MTKITLKTFFISVQLCLIFAFGSYLLVTAKFFHFSDPFEHHFAIFLSLSVIIVLILLFLMKRFIITPLEKLQRITDNDNDVIHDFYIDEFNTLYHQLHSSYHNLEKNKHHLQNMYDLKDYLYRVLNTFDIVNRVLIEDKPIDQILSDICHTLSQHGIYKLAWIGELKGDDIVIHSHSDDPFGYVQSLKLSIDPSHPTSDGPSAQCIRHNKTIVTPTINLEYYKPWKEMAQLSGIKSSICLPLRSSPENKPFGTMAIYASQSYGFLEEEIMMLEDLAGDIGYVIDARRRQDAMKQLLTTDLLTQLPNRSLLNSHIQNASNPKLLLININRLKDINSVFGYEVGDYILKACGSALNEFIKDKNGFELFKLHSDTFALLIDDETDQKLIQIFADDLVTHIANTPFYYNDIEISLSITTAYCDTKERLIENCAIALKATKKEKLSYKTFDYKMRLNKEHENNIKWHKILKEAIANHYITPYVQPIVDNKTGKITKYEALMRLVLPDGTVIEPSEFLEISKKMGLYVQLMKITFEKTIHMFKDQPYSVSLNISASDTLNQEFDDYLYSLISRANIGNKIIFEILENEAIENYAKVTSFIQKFEPLGCKFAIDDFGSGFSNFIHLINLNIDILKIDGSLIHNLTHDKNAQVIVKNIQNFASEMGIETVAEFVKNKEIFDLVKQMGITYSQGYFIGLPENDISNQSL